MAINSDSIFGEIVYSLRNSLELTQEQLAAQSYLSRDFISKLENGLRGPSVRVFSKLAPSFKMTALQLHEIFLNRLRDEGILEKWTKSRER